MQLGTKIRRIRTAKNIPAKQVADFLDMSLGGYNKIERNESEMNMSKLEKVAQVLDMTPEDILAFDEKIVFNNSTLHSSFNYGTVHNNFPEKLQQLYEDKISLLEDKVVFMQKEIDRLSSF